MELSAAYLCANGGTLEAALAAIPPLRLERFRIAIVSNDYMRILTKPTFSNVRFLIRIVLKYECCSEFPFYITDTGITFTHFSQHNYLTHPIRVVARDWFHRCLFQKQRVEAKVRLAHYKEELMAAAWHPRRVGRILAAGGFAALDDC